MELFYLDELGIGFIGSALCAALCIAGSIRGVAIVCEARAGLLSVDTSDLAEEIRTLQIIPAIQAVLGIFICFFALARMGVFGGGPYDSTNVPGLRFAAACLPMAIGGAVSASALGRVAASVLNLLARKPNSWGKGLSLCIIVILFAVLSFILSIVLISII